MEKENVQKLGMLYRKAKTGADNIATGLLESAMKDLVAAESAMTSMMVSESLAIETLQIDAAESK